MKKSIKIPVHHYIEITGQAVIPVPTTPYYVTNVSGKAYLVEIWQ